MAERSTLPRWSDFRQPSLFIRSPVYNPRSIELDAMEAAELNRLLAEVDSTITELRTQMHAVGARRIPEALGLGWAKVDTGPSQVDRMGDKELRVFTQVDGVQSYIDFDRGQFSELDAVIAQRDEVIRSGHNLVVEFFADLHSKDD